jgi:hypothetical protein
MPLNFKELEEAIRKSGAAPGSALIKKVAEFPDRTVIPSIMKVQNLSVPTLFLVCPESDMDYFKIKAPMQQPYIKFRFIETDIAPVIEILLMFRWGKQLALHLNPSATVVKKFLLGCFEQEAVSFTYFCPETGIIAYSFTGLDVEHLEWTKRNYDRSVCMTPVQDAAFSTASESLSMKFDAKQRYYRFGGKSGKRRKA